MYEHCSDTRFPNRNRPDACNCLDRSMASDESDTVGPRQQPRVQYSVCFRKTLDTRVDVIVRIGVQATRKLAYSLRRFDSI